MTYPGSVKGLHELYRCAVPKAGEEDVDDAVDVVHGQHMQDPVVGRPLPGRRHACCLTLVQRERERKGRGKGKDDVERCQKIDRGLLRGLATQKRQKRLLGRTSLEQSVA